MLPSPRILSLLALLLALAALLLHLRASHTAQPAGPDLPRATRLQCVSYSPYRQPGQSPFIANFVAPRAQLESDLRAIAQHADCVRLYSVDQGLDQVLPIARELRLKVLLGAWIGREEAMNRKELAHAVALANAYPDVVRALIVGNEVLLRREQTPRALAALIAHARAQVKVPVTYADVWEFWLRNRELEAQVDFVTVHILPYWEDDPRPIEHAIAHVEAVMTQVDAAFSKPLLIGETGWPSEGRRREHAVPSLRNEAAYLRGFLQAAQRHGWHYNIIEAVDQPWKRLLEGTVGGYWGIWDSDLQPKFDLAGAVANRQHGQRVLLAMLTGALLCGLLAHGGAAARAQFLLLGALAGGVLALQYEHMLIAYRNALEWSVLGAVAVLGALLPLLLARSGGVMPAAAQAWRVLARSPSALGHARRTPTLAAIAGLVRGLVLGAAAVAALLLWVDPRYRDFPVWLYLTPALAACLSRWNNATEERVLAILLLAGGVGRWLQEPANPEAMAWLATTVLLALPALRPGDARP